MRLHFCSLNNEWIDEIHKRFTGCEVSLWDISNLSRENTVFVSPANCLGFMDGGIDLVLSRKMFPGVEQQIRKSIKERSITTSLGRPYLPIGSALYVQVAESTGVICAPTMFLPHDVSTTQNAYYSFLAALLQMSKCPLSHGTLVVTSHCCGYGKMSASESASQMRRALDEFCALSGEHPQHPQDSSRSPFVVLMPLVDDKQPDNYDNREIKDVSFTNIVPIK